jgi:hypothetical protein
LGNRFGGRGFDLSGSEKRQLAVSCEHGNEIFGSIKGEEFID